MELSHAGPWTETNPRLPGKTGALPGVGSSDLVERSRSAAGEEGDLTASHEFGC